MKPLAYVTLFALLCACHKVIDLPLNPIYRGCDVAAYTKPFYSEYYPPSFPFLFRKTYDLSGTEVKEIDFSFWLVASPNTVRFHYAFVGRRGNVLFLTDTTDRRDTVIWITFNDAGRVSKLFARAEINDGGGNRIDELEQFTYRDDRVVSVTASQYLPGSTISLSPPATDSIKYDRFGNCVEQLGVPYAYDYTRKATQQFYCDDLMITANGFYLAQYLGLFPEITSPVNIRIKASDPVFSVVGPDGNHYTPLFDQTFDREGKLVSYEEQSGLLTTITWNCR